MNTEKGFENTGNKAWSTPVRISSFPPGSYENDISLAMDPDGNVMAVWAEYIYTNDHPYGEHQPLSSYFITGQGWSAPETLNDSYSSFVGDLKVEFDANRYAIATWYQVEDESFRGIQASRYVPGEGWGEPVTIYKSPFDISTNMNPQLAVASSGDAVVIWGDHQTQSVWTCLYTPGVGWAKPQEMEDTAGKIFLPIEIDVAIDDLGNAIAVWREEDPWRDIMASRYNGTTWSSPIPLEGFHDMDTNDPKIGLDASGYGIAIWETIEDDGARQIYSAR